MFKFEVNNICGSANTPPSFNRVAAHLNYARTSKLTADDGVEIPTQYQLSSLTPQEVVELYQELLKDLEQPKLTPVMEHYVFDIEDHMLRNASTYEALLKSTPLSFVTKLQKVITSSARMFELTPINPQKTKCIADYKIKSATKPTTKTNRPLRVLKITVENKRNPIGGVGAVVLGLNTAHKESGLDQVYSIHPLYGIDKSCARNYAFQGTFSHQYNGEMVTSSLYKNKSDHEYVIQPDPKYRDLFNIPSSCHVYSNTSKTRFLEREAYLGSSAASVAALYVGKSGEKRIDVLQSDDAFAGSFAFSLIRDVYTKMCQTLNLTHPKTIQVLHNGDLSTKCPYSTESMYNLGIKHRFTDCWRTDLPQCGVRTADKVICVSSELASRVLSNDPSISHAFIDTLGNSEQKNKVTSIRNGVHTQQFDVTNAHVFKEFALNRTYSPAGVETTDYVGYRKMLKQQLYQAGIIADPDRPLIAYIGRYSSEKGIDVLTDMIKSFSKNDQAQFITMGVSYGMDYYINQLKSLQKTSHKDYLRVYKDLKDQKKPFQNSKVSIAQLVRAAADGFIVPSHAESCGLVPMEAQCAGSFVIAPWHQGLKDTCTPVDTDHNLIENANAFCYLNHDNRKEAYTTLKHAISTWNTMTDQERNASARRLRNAAIKEYSWYHEDGNQISGAVVAYHKLYQQLTGSSYTIPKQLNVPTQKPIQPYLTSNISILQRILRLVRKLLDIISCCLFQNYFFFKKLLQRT